MLFGLFFIGLARRCQQVTGQLPPNWLSHPFLEFPDDLTDQSSFVSLLTALLSKKISIPHALSWRVADDSGLTTRLASFLTRVLWDDCGLELFICHG